MQGHRLHALLPLESEPSRALQRAREREQEDEDSHRWPSRTATWGAARHRIRRSFLSRTRLLWAPLQNAAFPRAASAHTQTSSTCESASPATAPHLGAGALVPVLYISSAAPGR